MRKMKRKIVISACFFCLGTILFGLHFGPKTPAIFKGNGKLCPTLRALPYGEDLGIVKSVQTLEIEGTKTPYNPGLVAKDDGFFLVFRSDEKEKRKFLGITTPFKRKIPFLNLKMACRTRIYGVSLDSSFKPLSSPRLINTGSDFSEDPRLLSDGDQIYLTYNDLEDNSMESRTIRFAKLNTENCTLENPVNLELNLQTVEKNWVPFVHEIDGEKKVHFNYLFNPHVILKMDDPTKGELSQIAIPNHIAIQKMPWRQFFGAMRGGTPPILVDGQYLAFFHSFFQENGKIWYVMGACTFEGTFPFRLTACSNTPLLFKGIYTTKAKNTGHSKKPVIYPSGIALGKQDGKDVVYLACGENDCAIKILTLDKEKLLQSLTPIQEHKKGKAPFSL